MIIGKNRLKCKSCARVRIVVKKDWIVKKLNFSKLKRCLKNCEKNRKMLEKIVEKIGKNRKKIIMKIRKNSWKIINSTCIYHVWYIANVWSKLEEEGRRRK